MVWNFIFDSWWLTLLTLILMWGLGVILGYVLWAPDTAFKKNFLDGMSFSWIIRKILRFKKAS